MIAIGDRVIFLADGARGIVIRLDGDRCQVLWEDLFVSWEQIESLRKEEESEPERPAKASPDL